MDLNTELHDLLIYIEHEDSTIRRPQRAKIPLVPPMLRNVESDKICYDPQVISIGPYHYGKLVLEEGEKLKIEIASKFFGRKERANVLYNSVLQVSEEARKYYVECPNKSRFNDNEFTRIMFLDGCFLLQYMRSIKSGYLERLKLMSAHSIALVARDLLMVENQLPTIVIDALLDHETCDPTKNPLYVYNFIMELYGNRLNRKFERCAPVLPKEIKRHFHLLDLFRDMFLGPREKSKQDGEFDGYGQLEAAPFHCSVKELGSLKIRLKVDPDLFPTDIHFQSRLIYANLTLPRIIVDGSTKGILLNMIAYEMCKEDDPGDYGVTDFIYFMDSLIDHVDDAKLLRSSGILYNVKVSDEQAADLFNHILENLSPSPNAYWTVKQSIGAYFRFMALCATIILLLSIIQTIVSAIQTHYTIHPPGN